MTYLFEKESFKLRYLRILTWFALEMGDPRLMILFIKLIWFAIVAYISGVFPDAGSLNSPKGLISSS